MVVNYVNIEVETRKIVGIVIKNGSGKTNLFKSIYGVILVNYAKKVTKYTKYYIR